MNAITVSGPILTDPQIRYTPEGQAQTDFTIVGDAEGHHLFVHATGALAENAALSFCKGHRVIVHGYFDTITVGETPCLVVVAKEVGASVLESTVEVTRNRHAASADQ